MSGSCRNTTAEGRQFDGGTVRSGGGGVALDDREAGWMGDGEVTEN